MVEATVMPVAGGIVRRVSVGMSARVVSLMTLDGADGGCTANLPCSEEGAQIRVEAFLPTHRGRANPR
jgi:hypothetical protein